MFSKCDFNCLECVFSDCINEDAPATLKERRDSTELDVQAVRFSLMSYDKTSHRRQIKTRDQKEHIKARNHFFHQKYYYRDVEESRRKSRENYRRHKEDRDSQCKQYYAEHRDEILANKKSYYVANRETILADRKAKYVPKEPRPLIDTEEAELKRQRERERYHRNREEINAKRRARRKELKRENSKEEQPSGV